MSSKLETFPNTRLVSASPIDSRTMFRTEWNDFSGCSPIANAIPDVRDR